MWRRATTMLLAPLVLITVAACARGGGLPTTKAEATRLVNKLTPLRQVDEVDIAPPGPMWWVFYGRDATGRPLVAWVWHPDTVGGYVYIEPGMVTAEQAVAKAKTLAGFTVWDHKPVLVRPARPYWWVFLTDEHGNQVHAQVDLVTGKLLAPGEKENWP